MQQVAYSRGVRVLLGQVSLARTLLLRRVSYIECISYVYGVMACGCVPSLRMQSLIEGVTVGFNATVFAYGATGAGKTFTMLGSASEPGIMILTLRDLYRRIEVLRETTGNIVNVRCRLRSVRP
jgi:hypothetical protein